jgi:multidrug efflux pump subunit AcrA (membrane-fusion protein)
VNGKAVKVAVKVKQRLRGRILVDGVLIEGENLIAEGVQRLRSGQAIETKETRVAGKNTAQETRG